MAFTDQTQLGNLLKGELNNNTAFQAGAGQINNLYNNRLQLLMSRLATTGLGRTGIGGAAANQISQSAGQSFSKLAGSEADRRSQIIQQMLGLYTSEKKREDSKTSFLDFLGSGLGMLAGSFLGPIGAAGGGAIGNLLTGGKGGGGSLYIPSIENLK